MASTFPLWRPVGELHGLGEQPRQLWLRADRPLSYLRVSAADNPKRPGPSFAKTAIESRNTSLTRRYGVVFTTPEVESALGERFADAAIPGLFAALQIEGQPGATLTLLTLQQVHLLAQSEPWPVAQDRPVRIDRTRVEVARCIDPWELPADFDDDKGFRYQYRYGIARLADAEPHTLVWPNSTREKSYGSDYVAHLTPEHLARLNSPSYVVIENAADPGKYAAALARPDSELEGNAKRRNPLIAGGHATDVVALDRGVREVLGISDGELAVVHPWDKPGLGATIRRRAFKTRSVYAHPSLPLRGDLEKPVCRLSKDAMSSIGAREGDYVEVSALVRGSKDFKRTTIKKRALLIDRTEAEARAGWASADAEEGYIDCAELHGIFPRYPTIYLDYFDQRELFGEGQRGRPLVCPVVQVRPLPVTRFADEASEFTWVGIVAVVAVAARALEDYLAILGALAVVLLALLVYARVRRATR